MPKKNSPADKPYGREQAMSELLVAARTLFAAHGYDAVSVRDISQLANVNHALLHRHFGTKENLLRALMQQEAARFTAAIGEVDDPAAALQRLFTANAEDITFARLLAYVMLSSLDATDVLAQGGSLKHIADAISAGSPSRAGGDPTADAVYEAAETTAIVSALALGWLLFEPFLAAATGLDDGRLSMTRSRVQALVGELAERAISLRL